MIDRDLGVRARDRRAWLFGVVLAVAPLAGGCVSAVDDSTAFGFAGGGASEAPAAEAAPAIAETEGRPDGSGDSPSPEDRIAAAAAGADGRDVAAADGASAPRGRASAGSPFLSNAASIAAFAGGTVTDGEEPRENRSQFGSLFASSQARTPLANANRTRERRVILQRDGAPVDVASAGGDSALPGVDASSSSLFEIGQRASLDDEEYMEDTGAEDGSYEVASLTGLARLTPNGLIAQRKDVVTQCFQPELVTMIRAIEQRFGKKAIVTSGYRSPSHNRRVNGARHSMHLACKAADIVIPGVDRFELANFARTLPGRGGVGTYCHTAAVHVDIGRQRDWNWGCRRRG